MILLNSYILPENLRDKFKVSNGKIVRSYSELKESCTKLITVGDYVSYLAIKDGLNPDMLVYDGKTKRSKDGSIKKFLDDYDMGTSITINNRPGTISGEAVGFFKSYKFDKRIKVFIDGEEDMLSIMAILYAPKGSMVVYGVPNVGMACVKVDDESRKKVQKLFDSLESREE